MSTSVLLGSLSGDCLIVTLLSDPAGAFRVRSVEVVSDDLRNKYAFSGKRSIESVFDLQFARCFLDVLHNQPEDCPSTQLPEFEFSLRGVGLSGLRILTTSGVNDQKSIILHFKRYVGDIRQLLLFEKPLELPPATVRERIAVEVLCDIVNPIFDMMSLTEPGARDILAHHSADIETRLQRLASQRKEIQFYAGLLQRYVAGCQEDASKKVRPGESAPPERKSVTPAE